MQLLSLCSSTEEQNALRSLQDLFSVDAVPTKLKRNYYQHLKYFLSPHPHYRNVVISTKLSERVNYLTSREKFDVVQVEGLWLAYLLDQIKTGMKVLDNHNVQTIYFKRLWRHSSLRPREKFFSIFDILKLPRYEKTYSEQYDACLCVSKVDLGILERMAPRANYQLVPNGVDIEYFQPSSFDSNSKSIVHVGYYQNLNNVDSVVWFAKKVFPLVLQRVPGATFTIIGAGTPSPVRALAQSNILVTGFVEDVRPLVQKASVFVVPLRAGSGTRLKILEAMAMGKPVVSTSIGAEGLEVTDGENLVIADTEIELADRLVQVLNNPKLSKKIGHNARKIVKDKYSWKEITEDLYQFYARTIDSTQ